MVLKTYAVLLYYDWILTFPKEVKYIWGARFSLSTLFYIFCRYALLANVLYLLEISNVLGSRVSHMVIHRLARIDTSSSLLSIF
ncbi:hypothetical protein BT96DRAFT_820880 [Gymnopus androsaceus JB14]|uniref:DUF6533 domain-containing protein n=1 Tax=Gymnopus androsaceus JB14 TaxID=1447944 RepID=A0A6A4HNM3_9AGAR|nr:hypothetical protein BT96DRAFT_820880 [Gymnopus androsaceus JB14]